MDCHDELIKELRDTSHLDPLREVCADAIEQLVKERDEAVKCIEDIETYLQWSAPQYAYKVIEEWRGVQE